jgi:hypothetical protein
MRDPFLRYCVALSHISLTCLISAACSDMSVLMPDVFSSRSFQVYDDPDAQPLS